MKKIPTLFVRDHGGDCKVTDAVTPGCEWVLAGEGVATRKYDGACCAIRGGRLYKRREVRGQIEGMGWVWSAVQDFEPVEYDFSTGKAFGWVPVGDGPDDRWFREAFAQGFCVSGPDCLSQGRLVDGTYELCGPKVQGNPDGFVAHRLVAHGMDALAGCPRDFAGLRDYLLARSFEGVVFHAGDGRMAKIKRRDFRGEGAP